MQEVQKKLILEHLLFNQRTHGIQFHSQKITHPECVTRMYHLTLAPFFMASGKSWKAKSILFLRIKNSKRDLSEPKDYKQHSVLTIRFHSDYHQLLQSQLTKQSLQPVAAIFKNISSNRDVTYTTERGSRYVVHIQAHYLNNCGMYMYMSIKTISTIKIMRCLLSFKASRGFSNIKTQVSFSNNYLSDMTATLT